MYLTTFKITRAYYILRNSILYELVLTKHMISTYTVLCCKCTVHFHNRTFQITYDNRIATYKTRPTSPTAIGITEYLRQIWFHRFDSAGNVMENIPPWINSLLSLCKSDDRQNICSAPNKLVCSHSAVSKYLAY